MTRALISVSDKTGIVAFAQGLIEQGVEIISTGGTKHALDQAGIKTLSIEEVTGFPEMMDGRVKTLHPKIHGGLLGRRDLLATWRQWRRKISNQSTLFVSIYILSKKRL